MVNRKRQDLLRRAEEITDEELAEMLAVDDPELEAAAEALEAERLRRLARKVARMSRRERCGAKSKRTGKPCQQWAMPNGRCRLHGGLSTGPRTPEGRERIREAMRRYWRRKKQAG